MPKNSGGDEKKLQSVLKKLQVNPVGAIEKVFFVYDNDKIQVFDQPKVQCLWWCGVCSVLTRCVHTRTRAPV